MGFVASLCATWRKHYWDCPYLAPEISGKQLELLKEIIPPANPRDRDRGKSTNPRPYTTIGKEVELAAGQAFKSASYKTWMCAIPRDFESYIPSRGSKGRADAGSRS